MVDRLKAVQSTSAVQQTFEQFSRSGIRSRDSHLHTQSNCLINEAPDSLLDQVGIGDGLWSWFLIRSITSDRPGGLRYEVEPSGSFIAHTCTPWMRAFSSSSSASLRVSNVETRSLPGSAG